MNKLKKGKLIVFEGIDGGGKTTQAKMLMKRLHKRGYDAVYFQEPSGSRWGMEIRKLAAYKDSISPEGELDLFLKDRRENVEKNLKPALKENKIVILDRYYYSTIAYQGAKGISRQRIRKMNEEFAVLPDLVIILDIGPSQGLCRIGGREKKDLLFEREDYLLKVREIFNSFREDNIVHIKADRSLDQIAAEIEQITLGYLIKQKTRPDPS